MKISFMFSTALAAMLVGQVALGCYYCMDKDVRTIDTEENLVLIHHHETSELSAPMVLSAQYHNDQSKENNRETNDAKAIENQTDSGG